MKMGIYIICIFRKIFVKINISNGLFIFIMLDMQIKAKEFIKDLTQKIEALKKL